MKTPDRVELETTAHNEAEAQREINHEETLDHYQGELEKAKAEKTPMKVKLWAQNSHGYLRYSISSMSADYEDIGCTFIEEIEIQVNDEETVKKIEDASEGRKAEKKAELLRQLKALESS